jgi:hypothetical protein
MNESETMSLKAKQSKKYYLVTLKVEAVHTHGKSYLNDARVWLNKVFRVNVFCSTNKLKIEELFGNCMVHGIIEKKEYGERKVKP